MAEERYIDFDAALAEAEERPVVVRYQGRDWTLFSAIPAKPVFKLMRLKAQGHGGDSLSQAEMVEFMTELVPAGTLEEWLDGGISIDAMTKLLLAIVNAYTGTGEEEASGEAPSPETGPESSSTGSPSRPTSPASMPSISPEQ